MKFILWGAIGIALMGLVGCSAVPEIPYDRSAAQSNKTIGLLTPGWPSGPTSFLASDPGRSFGLVGALVDAAIQSNREKDLTSILQTKNLVTSDIFSDALSKNLEAKGFKVIPVSADAKRTKVLKQYPAPTDGVDSYLDIVVIDYGYLSSGIGDGNPYRPWFVANVKLVRASDSNVLMQDTVTYNTIGEAKNVVTLSPDPQYAFVNWTDVQKSPDQAASGVSDATHKSAEAIGDLLK